MNSHWNESFYSVLEFFLDPYASETLCLHILQSEIQRERLVKIKKKKGLKKKVKYIFLAYLQTNILQEYNAVP